MSAASKVAELARRLNARRVGREYRASCPTHRDEHPSLDFHAEGERVLFTCRAGCASGDVFAAMRERFPDLFTSGRNGADAPEAEYAIRDATGAVVAIHVRLGKHHDPPFVWRRPSGEKGLGGRKAAELPLYKLPELLAAKADGVGDEAPLVVVCEGEKACDAARALGFVAVGTVTGASGCPSDESLRPLVGCRVALWPDADAPGRAHMSRIASRLAKLGAELAGYIVVPDARTGADAADFRGTRDAVLRLLRPRLDEADQSATTAETDRPAFRLVDLADVLDDAEAELQRFSAGDRSRLVTSGIPSLDHALHGGYRRGTVALIGAPTGAGKTTLMTVMAGAIVDAGGAVLFVSPEMSAAELAEREIVRRAGVARVERASWKLPERRDHAIAAHRDAIAALRERRGILLLDEPGADMGAVEAAAFEAKRLRPDLAAILLDYAQVLGTGGDPRTPRYVQVGAVGSRAVELARRLDVAVVLTTQVNRVKGEDGPGFAVRESQMLEHIAALVMFLSVTYDEDPRTGRRVVAEAKLCATKNRHGGLFALALEYRPELFRIGDPEPQDHASARSWRR